MGYLSLVNDYQTLAEIWGKSIVEFKKGIKGIGDEIDSEADRPSLKEEDKSKTADLPPAKVTPDPSKNVDEVKQDLDD